MHVRPKEESMDELFQAILSMKTLEECRAFLESTGASTATISRVNRALNYGKGGYQIALERLKR